MRSKDILEQQAQTASATGAPLKELLVTMGDAQERVAEDALQAIRRTLPADWKLEKIDGLYVVRAWVSPEDAPSAAAQLAQIFRECDENAKAHGDCGWQRCE